MCIRDRDENRNMLNNERLQEILLHISEQPRIRVTYFQPDERKHGGAYRTLIMNLKKIDEYNPVSYTHLIKINEEEKYFIVNDERYNKGDYISLDGSTGNIYGRKIKTVPAEISGDFERFMKWADEVRTLKVRTNADTPKDAAQAVAFGAEGIGLVRTEPVSYTHLDVYKRQSGCIIWLERSWKVSLLESSPTAHLFIWTASTTD